MNKFKEFDLIQTPNSWKENVLNQSFAHKKRVFFSHKFALVCFIVVFSLSSLGIVYACHDEFQLWLHKQFENKIIVKSPELSVDINKGWENFLYYYKEINDIEEVITDVYYFDDGKYIKKDIQHLKGSYDNQMYEFDYVCCGKDIFTFHHKGYIEYTIPMLKGDLLYFGSADTNLCSLNMKTNEIKKITNDDKSVNFTMSPNQTYIMINKSDEYWTIYNINTQKEIRFDDLNGYAHDNEYAFLDDSHLLYFSSMESTSLLDLKTMKSKRYDKLGWSPIISTMYFEYEGDKIIVENFMTNQKRILPYNRREYSWYVLKNRYIIFESLKSNKIILYDFEMDRKRFLIIKSKKVKMNL